MTTASELFFNRRSRIGRSEDVDLGISSVRRNSHHTNRRYINISASSQNGRRHQHNLDGCNNPSRRHPQPRRIIRRPSESEQQQPIRLNQGGIHSTSENVSNSENFGMHDGPRITSDSSLPGAVLLARERLIQRLRGVSLTGSRRNNRAPSGTSFDEFASLTNELRLIDAGDWETEVPVELLNQNSPRPVSIFQTDQPHSKRPAGLSAEAVDCLRVEVFKGGGLCESKASLDCCSICLETFMEGDELICLLCGHRFHSACLDPWIRTCGDCPYCRTEIEIKHYKKRESP